ncbi:MAG: endonuclease/exonuclease/phosphatase family protein [Acidobacteria bacterium]|nr:endonuclease/exonuclease/phosphatase family protein [Acidobacteriota bacterium]
MRDEAVHSIPTAQRLGPVRLQRSRLSRQGLLRTLLTLFGLVRLAGFATDPLLDGERLHAVVGEPSRVVHGPAHERPLTVVSWNIARGTRYEEIRDVLVAADADVYLLQEADHGVRRSKYRNVAADLAADLGMNWVFAGEFQEIGESKGNVPALTGQAVLSRYPIDDAVALRFKNQADLRWKLDPFQPRRGGRIALRVATAGIVFYNAHIESAKDDRFRHKQIDEMLADRSTAVALEVPVVFAGDFNTLSMPHDSPIVRCLTKEGFVDALGTIDAPRRTSIHHRVPLDWIFSRNITALGGRVIDGGRASDHLPLVAEFATSTVVASLR